jgi:hypothetical protein
MQFSTPINMPVGKPGHLFEGVRSDNIRSYANASGGSISETRLSIAIQCPPAEPFCISRNDADKLTLVVTTTGACCIPAIEIEYCFPDPIPKTPDELYQDLIDTFVTNPRLGGLGKFSIDGATGELVFVAYQPGLNVNFRVEADPSRVVVAGSSIESEGMGQHICPGLAVVFDPTAEHVAADDFTEEDWGIAFLPTQDLSDAAATQKWAGIIADCPDGEQAPAMGCWPNLTNCGPVECMPKPKCLRVLECGSIIIQVEQNADLSLGCPTLYYRYAADGDYTQLGGFTFAPGPGVAPVPVSYKIIRAYSDGLVKLSFGGCC